ncbi:hypothetical protein N0V90_002432 [Kalmusia sp. IMI 367209]|nr:hypothetical protein N0V90_002432 [Kalmusia sp. IMI 367209]
MSLDPGSAAEQTMRDSSSQPHLSGDAIIDIGNDNLADNAQTSSHWWRRKEGKSKVTDAVIEETVILPMDQFPTGYPLQAAFQSSDTSFSIYRGFDYLHSRVILELQDELRCLEENLIEMDEDDAYSGDPRQSKRVRSRDADLEEGLLEATQSNQPENLPSKRANLLAKIRSKLVDYDDILVKARELAEFQRPTDRDYLNVRRWFHNVKPLSYELEEEFIQRRGDLITLRPRAEWGRFDGWIHDRISKIDVSMPTRLTKVRKPLDLYVS